MSFPDRLAADPLDDTARFGLSTVVAATVDLRRRAAETATLGSAGRSVVDTLRSVFRDGAGAPVFATAELFVTSMQPMSDTRWFECLAAAGDVTASDPRPLISAGDVASIPLLDTVVHELRLAPLGLVAGESLGGGVDELAACLQANGNVLVLGGVLPGGELFAARLVPTEPIGTRVLDRLRIVASAIRFGLVHGMRLEPGRLIDQSAKLAELVGGQAADLESVVNELRAEAELFDSLHSVGRRLTAQLDLDKLVQDATDAATRATSAQFGAFFYNLIDTYGESYTLYTLSGVPRAAFERFPMPRNTGVFAPTFNGEGIVRSDDITADPRYGHNAPHHGMPAGHLPVRSYLAVPVISPSSGEVLGGFFFGHPAPGRFSTRHEHVASGIAGYAAISLDNARLYQQQRRLATELQASMLPDVRAVPGFDVVSRYLPAAAGSNVGGDWLDVIELPAARTAFAIGDVMGRGVSAAATMGQVRTAIRAYATLDTEPAQLLQQVNDLLATIPGEHFVTCLYAVHDAIDETITYASAGHLPPIVVAPDGAVEVRPDRHDLPLGVGTGFNQREVRFPVGGALVLYTDGLVERRDRSVRDGIDTFVAALPNLCQAAPVDLGEVADRLIFALTGGKHNDDIAFLYAREQARLGGTARIALAPEPASAAVARRFIDERLTSWKLDDWIGRANLVATELVSNAVRHSGSLTDMRLHYVPDRLIIAVGDRDQSLPRRMDPALDDERHRGLFLVDTYSKRWGTRRTGSGKVVWAELSTTE